VKRFEGRRTLVTGAASGIGRATALRLLDEGAAVVAADINEDGLKTTMELAADSGTDPRLTSAVLDIADEAAVDRVVPAAIANLGGLDVLVNAAGILRGSHTHTTTLELWNTVLQNNLTGTFLVTRAALPSLLETGSGVVVNFSSTSASFAHPYMAAYAASKGGIQAFTHALALEYSKRGLRAVCVAPGSIASGMTAEPCLPADIDAGLLGKLVPAIGQGFAPPERVAGVVTMLASNDGAFITGTEIRIDGGTHM
jgi:NAD(P)-dependent dehydrogenase (short-subunit alcohol dehydrogenase family)